MSKSKKFDEHDFLDLFYQEMLRLGQPQSLVSLSVDTAMVKYISDKLSIVTSEDDLKKMADICLANSWIKHMVFGNKYGGLQLTTTGFGVAKSKQMRTDLLNNRSTLKKLSDYIVEHKGLFILVGSIVSIFWIFK